MWSDKYKPRNLEDVLLPITLKKKLVNFTKIGLPNLILTGEVGCGKSCILMCMAREIYQRDINTYVCKLNSSIEKNIKLLKEQLEQFCRVKVPDDNGHAKMFIIDDIDYIPEKVQLVIASYMGRYTNIHFAFTCVNTTDICETIQSQCIIMHIPYSQQNELVDRLKQICAIEHIKYSDDALLRIVFLSQGDNRIAINNLQSISVGYRTVTIENINKICDVPNPIFVEGIIKSCIKKEGVIALQDTLSLFEDGYTSLDILACIFDVLRNFDIDDKYKIPMMTIIGKTMYKISRKVDSALQLEKCIIKICANT